MGNYQISLSKRNTYDYWRALARYWQLSAGAKQRLEWIIFYHTVAKKNAQLTAEYFGISRKTFHKWLKRFDPHQIQSLEESSRRPHNLRHWEVTKDEEEKIVSLRKKYLAWGKLKLKKRYFKEYGEKISTWKIEIVVRKHKLYPDPVSHQKLVKRRSNQKKRVRIHTLDTTGYDPGKLWHVDTVIVDWYGQKRSILTALEDKTKLGYARVYKNHSSRSATDFLKRLVYLSQGDISIVHSDNGSEFAGEFEKGARDLSIFQVYSRVRTPNDNPALERFNRTLQDEWLALSQVGLDDIGEANLDLTDWLIIYNSIRPHQALDYETPLEYAHHKYFQVLPMYPASTTTCRACYNSGVHRVFDALLRKNRFKDVVSPRVRETQSYLRLKEKFAQRQSPSGLGPQDLTVGDLVDILDVYLEMSGGGMHGPYHHGLVPMLVAVAIDPGGEYTRELHKLNRTSVQSHELDRTSGLYTRTVDLRQALEEERGELSHYPGGIVIREKQDDAFHATGFYELFLTNRQQMTNNVPIFALFQELGIPVAY